MAENEATLLVRIKQVGGEILDKLSSTIGSITEYTKKAALGIAAFGAAGLKSFKESEEASNALTQSMINQGLYTTELKKKYDEMATAIEETTTFSDEQVTAAQAVMTAHMGQIEITEDLMKATADLAAGMGTDLVTAATMVSKTIGGSTNALARQQIEVNTNATASQKYAQVLEQLNNKFAGQAAAAAQGMGSLSQLKNVLDNVMELVGESLAPVISYFTLQLIDFAKALKTNKDFADGLNSSIDFLAKTFVVMKQIVVGTVEALSAGLAFALEGVTKAIEGNLSQAMDLFKIGFTNMKQIAVDRYQKMNEELAQIDELRLANQQNRALREEQNVKNSLDRQAEVKQKAYEEQRIKEELARQERYEANAAIELAELESIGSHQDKVMQLKISALDKEYAQATTNKNKLKILEEKAALQQMLIEEQLSKSKKQMQAETFSTIATLQGSHNKALAMAGKAAGITQIAIDTPVAISKTMAAFPAPLNFALAGAVGVAMAAQAAKIAGIPLAEGGIVKATPGGIQATIGEGGRDEAVIPLENGQIPGSNQGNTIIFNGPVMGDESQAMEFARAIDKSLLKLRQSNQSVAFERDIF
jgi:hypothetical protein